MSDAATNNPTAHDKVLLTIDERILAIEAAQVGTPGTTITRVMKETQGVQWCLSLGGMSLPKAFIYGETIEEVLTKGEAAIAEMQAAGMQRVPTGWDMLDAEFSTLANPRRKKRTVPGASFQFGEPAPAKASKPRKAKNA